VTPVHADGPVGGSVGGDLGDRPRGGRDDTSGDADPDREFDDTVDDDVIEAEILDEHDETLDDGEAPFVDGTVGRSDLAAERDEYLDALQRVKAEFDNYRRRTESQRTEMVERAVGKLVDELLPALDACDAAVEHGASEVEPIASTLLEALTREGLERMDVVGQVFDPNLHEAVMHEPGDGDDETVVESFRTGYLWKGRVLRPAMVKVRG
jgi:molecular chaperone GrpE